MNLRVRRVHEVFDMVATLKGLGARVVYLDQCRFGALRKKPTMILTSNASWLWSISSTRQGSAHRFLCQCTIPHELQLVGRNEAGHFRTAAAKSYPSGLCNLFATAIIQSILARSDNHELIDSF